MHERASRGLLRAAQIGHTEAARFWIARGADLNAPAPDVFNGEFLDCWVQFVQPSERQECLLLGDTGVTPLMFAAGKGHLEVLSVLLEAGAEVDAAGDSKHTPLMLAACSGQTAAVRMLLAAGANPRAQNSTGDPALALALRSLLPDWRAKTA